MQLGLQTLLGQEAAAAVLAAAEAAAGTMIGPQPGDMPRYTSMAATMPVSMKVSLLRRISLFIVSMHVCTFVLIRQP
jgi:hypothetical protein